MFKTLVQFQIFLFIVTWAASRGQPFQLYGAGISIAVRVPVGERAHAFVTPLAYTLQNRMLANCIINYSQNKTWPFIIKSPKQYKNLSFMDAMNKFKWTKKEGLSFNKLVLSLPVNVRCSKTDNAEWSIQGMTALPPDIERPYKAEPLVCGTSSVRRSFSLQLLLCLAVLGGSLGSTCL